MATRQDDRPDVLEHGDIFFFMRPKVEQDEPSGLSDVQRFFIVLRPEGKKKLRLMAVGRKRLPDVERHERNWGFVSLVTGSPDRLRRELQARSYRTKTRGEQHQPAARPAGEGVYTVTLSNGQMHLAYALELPEKPGDVQRQLRIAPEASFAISVKNPEADQPPGAGLEDEREADYPDRLQREFRGRKFAREDVRLLDYEGAEFILVGARTNPEQAYDIELDTEHEDEQHAEIMQTLHLRKSEHPVEPLFEGDWA